jgi:hypothetical protein
MVDLLTDRFQHVATWTIELNVPSEGKVVTIYVGTYLDAMAYAHLEAKAWAHSCEEAVEVLAIRED